MKYEIRLVAGRWEIRNWSEGYCAWITFTRTFATREEAEAEVIRRREEEEEEEEEYKSLNKCIMEMDDAELDRAAAATEWRNI